MRIFLSGVSCVGKTTISEKLAVPLDYHFFDLDKEIEKFFGTSIERFRNRFWNINSYRKEASKALMNILAQEESRNCVIALSPSGLMDYFWKVVKKAEGIVIVIEDDPKNILERVQFYDIDSQPINQYLTEEMKKLCLREIKKDITYYRKSFQRADFCINIAGLGSDGAAAMAKRQIKEALQEKTNPRLFSTKSVMGKE